MNISIKGLASRVLPLGQLLSLMLLVLFFISGCSSELKVSPPTDTSWLENDTLTDSSPYLLGPGNKLSIISAKWSDLNVEVEVNSEGDIQYPYLGQIHVEDMTIDELRIYLTEGLQDYYKKPRLTLNLLKEPKRFAYILGEVFKPGPIPLNKDTTLIDAIGMAGGSTPDAELKNVAFLRPTEDMTYAAVLDLRTFQSEEGKPVVSTKLREKDVIYVPANTIANVERFFIRLGHIVRPLLDIERGVILIPDLSNALNDSDENNRTIIIAP